MAGKQQIEELTAEIRALREELARVRAEQASHSCFHYHYTPIPWQPQPAPLPVYPVWTSPGTTWTCELTTGAAAGQAATQITSFTIPAGSN